MRAHAWPAMRAHAVVTGECPCGLEPGSGGRRGGRGARRARRRAVPGATRRAGDGAGARREGCARSAPASRSAPTDTASCALWGSAPPWRRSASARRPWCCCDGLNGRRVARLRLPGADRAHWRLLHRADLLGLLADACRASGVEIRTGATVARVAATDRRPVIETESGERAAPDLLVGADGARSIVRAVLNGDAAPRYGGHAAWRAVVRPLARPAPEAVVDLFPGRHLVTYPLRDGALLNLVAVSRAGRLGGRGLAPAGRPRRAARGLRRRPPRSAPDVLEEVTETNLWGLFVHPVGGRLGLVGHRARRRRRAPDAALPRPRGQPRAGGRLGAGGRDRRAGLARPGAQALPRPSAPARGARHRRR